MAATTFEAHSRQQLVEDWFTEYKTPLARYLLRILGDEEQAADVLQETFLRSFTALASQVPPDNVYAWLYRIATNLAFNAIRRRNRFRWLPLSLTERAPTFEHAFATSQALRQCLARLRPKDAEALLLYEYVGLNCNEIAAQTGEESTAVRMRISRARQRFRDIYQHEDQ